MSLQSISSSDQPASERDVIRVYVRELDQLFDSMDPSPFHEKDLDRNAHEYIVSLARESPGAAPKALLVYLDKPIGPAEEGRLLGDAIRIYFARRANMTQRELRQLLRRGWISLIIGLTFLVASVVVGETVARRMGYGPLATVLRESLLIGGWVAMWRPMEILLYDWWAIRAEQRMYQRLSQMTVQIVYTNTGSSDAGNHKARAAAAVPPRGASLAERM